MSSSSPALETSSIAQNETDPEKKTMTETSDASKSLVSTKKTKKKTRPARKQVETRMEFEQEAPEPGQVYNIWYGKWSGGSRRDPLKSQIKSETRCVIERDSGYTKADKVLGSYFCLFFARGMCSEGSHCIYLHRLPTENDIFNANVDCFGREKHADYRDDMGGVGSFLRHNHTLYVGQIKPTDDIEEVVARHFSEWGDIERIRVLNSRGIAFVTYVNEANAQFAKEAMAHQALDNDECLNVRWSTFDPNPAAQARNQRRLEERAAQAIKRLLPKQFLDDLRDMRDGTSESRKRRQREQALGLEGYTPSDELWYADGTNSIQHQLEQQKAITTSESLPQNSAGAQAPESTTNKFVSDDVLAALQQAASTHTPDAELKPVNSAVSGALVSYGSDDEDD
ncbi:RNA-binding protein Cwf2 [Schizosaccharomyces japonicus yFS275]|uniref:RNA-binding protein Cwf2 n=1 Tax=Schizosaccharomyces japonicus (strain yFS275 / FY16936) TaxID=402676 RepID=B6K822_SCHJY|nr:RNA-binding protein Cwf2 [Schizosaccharomyces japonicus yFS275]EEB09676.1 RNA-binding protein Cwf2 [Schizosaccharomyces japonicus yFS275]